MSRYSFSRLLALVASAVHADSLKLPIERHLGEAGVQAPQEMAQLIMATTHGISLKARSIEQLSAWIMRVVRSLLDRPV